MKTKELYKRFGLEKELEEVQKMFKNKISNLFIYTELGKEIFNGNSFWLTCTKLGIRYESVYSLDLKYDVLFERGAYKFEEYIIRLQTIIDILWSDFNTKELAKKLASYISKSLEDLPVNLGLKVIFYKTKSPQIIPSRSIRFDEEMIKTLELIDSNEKFRSVLLSFKEGLKEFLSGKTQDVYKDAIEDMYAACDNLVKIVTGDKNKGFKHISDKEVVSILNLNGHQKELYKNLRNWMDEIKHETIKDFDEHDTEVIIRIVGSFIYYGISKYEKKFK